MDIRAVLHNPTAATSELKWYDCKSSQPHGQSRHAPERKSPNMPARSLTVTWGNDKKLLAKLQAWQESRSLREEYLCAASGSPACARWMKAGCGGGIELYMACIPTWWSEVWVLGFRTAQGLGVNFKVDLLCSFPAQYFYFWTREALNESWFKSMLFYRSHVEYWLV